MHLKRYVKVGLCACVVVGHFGCLLQAQHQAAPTQVFQTSIFNKTVCGPRLNQSGSKSLKFMGESSTIFTGLSICGWSNAVLMTSADYTNSKMVDMVTELFSSQSIPVIRYSHIYLTREWIMDKFWHSYNVRGLRNFVWFGEDPDEIISIITDIFEREKRGSGAFLPQDLNIIIALRTRETSDPEKAMRSAVFDNVVLVLTDSETLRLDAVFTLKWRENKRRELERLFNSDSSKTSSPENVCEVIFPNKKYGMNGRTLVALTKGWPPFVYKEPDPISGKLKYVGFVIGLVDALAKKLNFTYELIPQSGEDESLTWDDYRVIVGNGSVDFGAQVYSFNTAPFFNHSVTMPFFNVNFTGMYVNPGREGSHNILNVFKPEVYFCIIGVLVFVMGLYPLESRLLLSLEHAGTTVKGKQMNIDSQMDDRLASEQLSMEEQISTSVCQCGSIVSIRHVFLGKRSDTPVNRGTISLSSSDNVSVPVSDHEPILIAEKCQTGTDVLFRFIGSVFNQGCLPRPSRGATRVLLWSWCLMLIILSTTFTGNLTADLVGQKDELPFNTYEELMKTPNFRWGIDKGKTATEVMKEAKEGTTLRKLYDGIMDFAKEDPSVLEGLEFQFSNIKSGHYVALMHSTDVIAYCAANNITIKNLVAMKEILMTSSFGLILPKHSALNLFFSRGLIEMMDYGIVDSLFREMEAKFHCSDDRDEVKRSRDLRYMSGPLIVCGLAVAVAVAVLVVECFFANWRNICKFLCKSKDL